MSPPSSPPSSPSSSMQQATGDEDALLAVDIGAQVRAARVLLGVSQSTLARSARLSLSTLNELERGRGSVRLRTRRQVASCLEDAGVVFVRETGASEGHMLGVLLCRKARPERVEDAQRWLDPDTLVPPQELVFFVASEFVASEFAASEFVASEGVRSGVRPSVRLGVRLLFPHRTLLLDLAGFDLSSLRLTALSRLLLSAFSFYGDRLFCTEPLRLPTLAMAQAAAYEAVEQAATRPLHDPFPLLELLTHEDEQAQATLASCLRHNDHPLARVRQLIEAQHDT